ncbi:hypothetical protein HY29_10230 [Hyphomonas beringensis]|uniref:Uncharacterized protein n=1 Tax=Hyphomonas beringensis TaxID=1280946 RepID=A0A062UHA5_9PROT|nr:hypothetical protein [Hyphomonas beringensis]KCZ55974.1 hypothetical protein HY29_10230 [Hyphomonas beringensis]
MLRGLITGGIALGIAGLAPAEETPTLPATFCERIAEIAAEEHKFLSTGMSGRAAAPFIRKWTVRSVLMPREDGKGYRRMGSYPECYTDETHTELERCFNAYSTFIFPVGSTQAARESHPEIFPEPPQYDEPVGLLPLEGGLAKVEAAVEYGSPGTIHSRATGLFLKSITDQDSMVCAFDNRVRERYISDPRSARGDRMCASIIRDEANIVTGEEKMSQEAASALRENEDLLDVDRREGTRAHPGDHYIGPYIDIDVNADGVDERLVQVTHSPGTGGCTYSYFDLLVPGTFDAIAAGDLREKVLAAQGVKAGAGDRGPNMGCSRKNEIRRVDGTVYFETRGFGLDKTPGEDNSYVTKTGGALQRTLRTVTDDGVQTQCSTQFSIEPIITYDRDR